MIYRNLQKSIVLEYYNISLKFTTELDVLQYSSVTKYISLKHKLNSNLTYNSSG